jgi:hypothetical protein
VVPEHRIRQRFAGRFVAWCAKNPFHVGSGKIKTLHQLFLEQLKDQRVEHYEIAGYGTVRAYAQLMGHTNAAKLLQSTLDEEAATDKKLTDAALIINHEVPVGH